MTDILDYLLTRRSVQAPMLASPGPDEDQIAKMLTAAARVPDHKKLEPWRFIRFDAEACIKIGDKLAERFSKMEPNAGDNRLKAERERFVRAPLVIAVVSTYKPGTGVPEWEQILSSGAVCMNLLHAAHASGFAAQWLSEWYSFDAEILTYLGLKKDERLAGFIHIGTPTAVPSERPRPDLNEIVSFWEG